MICPNCGYETEERFCGRCGCLMDPNDQNVEENENNFQKSSRQRSGEKTVWNFKEKKNSKKIRKKGCRKAPPFPENQLGSRIRPGNPVRQDYADIFLRPYGIYGINYGI